MTLKKKRKPLNCINCWNREIDESAALWKIYSDFNKGIMLKSKVSNLVNSLTQNDKEIYLSEVKYLNYETDIMPDGNSMFPVIHKQKAYSFENEVRLIHQIIPETGWEYDWSKEEVKEGLYMQVNLSNLIDEIVLSPFSPKWYFNLIEDIIGKYNLDKPVTKSTLSSFDL